MRVPSLPDATDKDLYVYYGNSGASDQQNVTGVWDVNFKAVMHLDETVTDEQSSGTHQDSTANNNNGGQNNNDDAPAPIGTGQDFDGDIDEVRVSDTARSAGWILTEYNNQSSPSTFYTVGAEEQDTGGGPFTDSTVSANVGAPGGSMTALDQVAGQVNGSLDFEGSDDYVGMSGFNATLLPATLSAWVNSDVSLSCSGLVFSRGTAVSGMNVGSCSNAFVLGYTWNDAANTYNWTGGPTVPVDEWVLTVLVVEAAQATATVYSSSGTSSAVNSVAHGSSVIDDLKIAQDDAGGRFFDGGIDEVRVSSVARSADWNAAQYKSMTDDFILWSLPVLSWQETEP